MNKILNNKIADKITSASKSSKSCIQMTYI